MSVKPGNRRKDRINPFAMLERSHERLQEHLAILLTAAATLNDDPTDTAACAQIVEVSEFIGRAVTRHEQDEEQSLFPRLRGLPQLATLLDSLAVEHRAHEKLHAQLSAIATACGRGLLDHSAVSELSDLAVTLSQLYSSHIEVEELELFPAARRALTPSEAMQVAAEMQARRGR